MNLSLVRLFTVPFCLALAVPALAATPDETRAAVEAQPRCDTFLRTDSDSIYIGLTAGGVSVVSIAHPNQTRVIATGALPVDAVHVGSSLWILTTNDLQEWNFETGAFINTFKTFDSDFQPRGATWPTAFALHKNNLVISHGAWGFSIFNLDSKTITHSERLATAQLPLISKTTGVSIIGDRAYFAMDSVSLTGENEKPPFRGLVIYNLASMKIESQMQGLDPGSDSMTAADGKLYVSFAGVPIWKYDAATLRGTSLPTPERRVWQFNHLGKTDGHPIGQASMDSSYYYTCFAQPGAKGTRYQNVPAALARF